MHSSSSLPLTVDILHNYNPVSIVPSILSMWNSSYKYVRLFISFFPKIALILSNFYLFVLNYGEVPQIYLQVQHF